MRISARGISLEVDDQGSPAGEPLLMIMGLGMQLVSWPDELVRLLVERGFRVIRFDNRDAGLSQGFGDAPPLHLGWAAMRYLLHLPVSSPYTLRDMADDALGVLDALGIERAHVCGASLGGMIAQHLAAEYPQRVKSLVLMMSSSGSRKLPHADMQTLRGLMERPAGAYPEALVDHLERVLGMIGSPAYRDPARLREHIRAATLRAWRPAGTARQMLAVMADGDRSALLQRIAAPTLVIHGRDDPLVPIACGEDLAQRIPGAVLDVVDGMGHDLPDALCERFADAIRDNARRAAGGGRATKVRD
jgi:pimeloyl-ACP methyl ester carboxylesterase